MTDSHDRDHGDQPEDELRRLLEQLLGGGVIDPSQLAGAAGLPADPAALQRLMMGLQQSMHGAGDGVDWNLVRDAAKRSASGNREVTDAERQQYRQAFNVAELWLSEASSVGDLIEEPRVLTQHEWIVTTLPTWQELCDPVASSLSTTLVNTLSEQAPEEFQSMIAQSSSMVKSMGQTMFGMQIGHTLGQLAGEVLAGGDIGMPVLPHGRGALVPQNIAAWAEGLEIPADELALWLAVRELAHARLFQHAKWLRLHLISSVAEFARGIRIDTTQIEEVIRDLELRNPEDLRSVLASGKLIPPRTPEQEAALARLETMVALIEGWVDVVTADATTRLPNASAIAEMVRRRRATGSPAERAFGTLVGLEIRPRRLREAAAMWRAVTDRLGAEARDALWDHRDALPDSDDIDAPEQLIDRLAGGDGERVLDELDSDLERLLSDPSSFGDAPSGGEVGDDAEADPKADGPDGTDGPDDSDGDAEGPDKTDGPDETEGPRESDGDSPDSGSSPRD